MGMLDEAIREHLELKRLRGADPSEVAREENEALGQVRREVEPPEDCGPGGDDLKEGNLATGESVAETSRGQADENGPSSHGGVSQETVEIDMERALADDRAGHGVQSAARAAPVGHPAHAQPSSEDSLEWEVPGDRPDGETAAAESDAEAPVEDVLEETPDFLRETPEHERLWFEQRPPRDFDFNE